MWTFSGYYTGEAKEYMQKIRKRERRILSLIISAMIVFACTILALVLHKREYTVLVICGGLFGVLIINVALFLNYRRSPKNEIRILNDRIQFTDSGSVCSLPFYKIDPIEIHGDFIVICNKLVLQKELLLQGDWEKVKLIFKKAAERLKADDPMCQIEEPEPQLFEATVKSKRIGRRFVGEVRMQHAVYDYFATFSLENGEETECEIGQELYAKIEPKAVGTLMLIDGRFLCFGEGEDIE